MGNFGSTPIIPDLSNLQVPTNPQPANPQPVTGLTDLKVPENKDATQEQEQKLIAASDCRTPPNAFQDLMNNLSKCATNDEKLRNANFGDNIIKLQQDIKDLQSMIDNSLANGDLLFGSTPHNEMIRQLQERNKELQTKRDALSNDIREKERIVERSNQDFKDVKKTVPDPQPKKVLRFVEDYTMAMFVISYVFMIVAIDYFYVYQAEYKLLAAGQSLFASVLLTAFLYLFFSR